MSQMLRTFYSDCREEVPMNTLTIGDIGMFQMAAVAKSCT